MKKILSLFLAALMILSLASCSSSNNSSTENTEPKKESYTLSDEVKEGSVIDGLMTDIDGQDKILTKTTASWLDTCVLYEVNIRQFTEEGTFAAFEQHLDRLKGMGINTLWLMPIHPISKTERKGSLGSYYSVSDYKGVNPEFGTIDDFKHLVDKAHGMGFKIILDWVANHTGWDNAWITEHPDWYEHDNNGKIKSPFDWTDTAQLNYENYEMRAEMIKSMQYWIEDIGIDGFRCDHAIGVPSSFWNAAVYKLKSVNSEIMMLAEMSGSLTMTNYAFDSCYNDALYGQALSTKGGVAVSSVKDFMEINQNYAPGSFPMNYLDNHDKNSYEGSIVERFGDTYQTLLALSYMTPGIPLIYTSDEMAYDHEIEFFEKDTVKWDSEPVYAPLIAALSKLKTENKALATSNTDIEFISADNSMLFTLTRTSGDSKVIYVGNLYYEDIKDVGVQLDFDKATCVMHHDGKTLDTEPKEMSGKDFAKRSYKPYEFYILTVD